MHKIYNDTTWQDRAESEGFKGMGFVIKKIVVHSEPTRVRGGEAHYNMIRDKWDVRNLLEVSSILNNFTALYLSFCLILKNSNLLGLGEIQVLSLFRFYCIKFFICFCFKYEM